LSNHPQFEALMYSFSMNKPYLVVITGRPGSGKTTLAHNLAKEMHCPAFCRDEFKEGFVNTIGLNHASLDQDINWQIYETFFQTVEFMVSKGVSLIVEAAFQHKLWFPKLDSLQNKTRMSIFICAVEPQVARSRFIARGLADPTREYFHGDQTVHTAKDGIELPICDYDPPVISVPTLTVNTANGYDPSLEDIVSFMMSSSKTIA
jgi:predicted kinase